MDQLRHSQLTDTQPCIDIAQTLMVSRNTFHCHGEGNVVRSCQCMCVLLTKTSKMESASLIP